MSIVKCHLKQLKDVEQLFWSVLTLCSMLIVSLGFVMCKMWCESFRGLRNILKAVALGPVSSVPPLLSYPFATDSIVVMDAYFLPQQRGGSWLFCQDLPVVGVLSPCRNWLPIMEAPVCFSGTCTPHCNSAVWLFYYFQGYKYARRNVVAASGFAGGFLLGFVL